VNGVERIAKERERQIKFHQWTATHDDDEHQAGELALAAALYATPVLLYKEERGYVQQITFKDAWPWDVDFDKRPFNGNILLANARLSKKRRIRQLEKAGALIAAEIDRLLRI
jgi:hypothetical protein